MKISPELQHWKIASNLDQMKKRENASLPVALSALFLNSSSKHG
jgi:hypothetical protein